MNDYMIQAFILLSFIFSFTALFGSTYYITTLILKIRGKYYAK